MGMGTKKLSKAHSMKSDVDEGEPQKLMSNPSSESEEGGDNLIDSLEDVLGGLALDLQNDASELPNEFDE